MQAPDGSGGEGRRPGDTAPTSSSRSPDPRSGEGRKDATDLRAWRTGEGRLLGVEIPQPRDGHLSVAVPPAPRGDEPASRPVESVSGRVWTLPNVISMGRIALIPVFVTAILGLDAPGKALAILAVLGASDWLDGKIARLWDMRSRLGAKLDPIADRILIAVVPFVFAFAGYVPWWVVWCLVARDVLLAGTLPVYRRIGRPPEVIYLGKAASFALMWSFPLLLAAEAGLPWADGLRICGEASLYWGVGLYLWSGAVYAVRAALVAQVPRRRRVGDAP